jgi:F-type H+-transporting ATPase subunit gamma
MPSLKDLRNRISSVTATRKITKAMQMVAAAKLRRAQILCRSRAPLCGKNERGSVQPCRWPDVWRW